MEIERSGYHSSISPDNEKKWSRTRGLERVGLLHWDKIVAYFISFKVMKRDQMALYHHLEPRKEYSESKVKGTTQN